MNQIVIVIIIAAVIGTVIITSLFFSKKARIKRKLKKASVKPISRFYTGDVAKIVGKVEFVDEPIRAPLSNRECAYYHVLVEQQVSTGKSSHWKKIIDEEKSCKFLIRDGSRYAFIKEPQLKSYIVKDRKYKSGFLKDATDVLQSYLKKHGYESENTLGLNKTIRYHEGILENGEAIAVLGRGEWKEAYRIGLPENYGKVLVISSTESDQVYMSDDPETLGKDQY